MYCVYKQTKSNKNVTLRATQVVHMLDFNSFKEVITLNSDPDKLVKAPPYTNIIFITDRI